MKDGTRSAMQWSAMGLFVLGLFCIGVWWANLALMPSPGAIRLQEKIIVTLSERAIDSIDKAYALGILDGMRHTLDLMKGTPQNPSISLSEMREIGKEKLKQETEVFESALKTFSRKESR